MFRRLLPFIFLLALTAVQAQALPVLEIGDLRHQVLRTPVEFFASDESVLPGQRIPVAADFRPLTGSVVNQGVTDTSYWLRVRLQNSGDSPKQWVVNHETTYMDYMVLHVADAGENFTEHRLSDRLPFDSRPVDYRKLAFAHTTAPSSYTDLYIQLGYAPGRADSVSLNVDLWDQAVFDKRHGHENLLFGLYYGNSLSLLVIALVLAVTLRRQAYVYYGLLVLGTAVFWLQFNGYGYEYLWPRAVYWQNEGFHILFLIFTILSFQFSRVFLNTRELTPRADRFLVFVLMFCVAGIVLRLAGLYVPVLYIAAAALASIAVLPVLGWVIHGMGLKHARWYAIAWTIYTLTLLLGLISAYTDILQIGMDSLLLAQMGSVLENVLLLFATARRAVSLEEDRRKAELLANTDPLTGLGNRRMLSLRHAALREAYEQGGPPVFFMIFDLDRFKQINDTYGHSAGDRVLIDFAKVLEQVSRRSDTCIRIGGEEFVLLLPAESLTVAKQVAERIRERFAAEPTVHRGVTIRHTVSVGITVVFDAKHRLSEKEMLASADSALYAAKAQGRNQVVLGAVAAL